jgi:hypothetical protein
LVEDADLILRNEHFIAAAKALFRASDVHPEFVLVNINAPMPAGLTHVDIPSFRGATREDFSLPLLKVMGSSGLFEGWRVVRAGAIAWFYEGSGGSFDYWPDGLNGPMVSERPPFGNAALLGDNDLMYHRIGAIGEPVPEVPMSAAAHIQPDGQGRWAIVENGEVRATYPSQSIRFSVLWKAEIRDHQPNTDTLNLDRITGMFAADLRRRKVEFQMPADPAGDTTWILLLQRIYADRTTLLGDKRAHRMP